MNNIDNSKKLKFDTSNITSGEIRVITMADKNIDLNELEKKQNATDALLETDSKDVIGAVNEVNTKAVDNAEQLQNCLSSDNIKTLEEYNALTTEEKNNGTIYAIEEV